jgi:hypothetical protein
MYYSTSTHPTDSIVESVINKYKQRSIIGIKKYGVTMDRNDLSDVDWLTHAQEEAQDLTLYLEKMIVRRRAEGQLLDQYHAWYMQQMRDRGTIHFEDMEAKIAQLKQGLL